ncbi:hypothetical protein ABW19_dt0209143 [Dactylella cylindrospora]|nr:hypothetical protein ABW19_dt0209143 [Dactylella cylindrospora]
MTSTSYSSLLSTLPTHPSIFKPSKPRSDATTTLIAELQLHPAIEAALHILNDDLSSAHFLVRKMQAEPAFAGMMLHAVLHRIEGDYDHSREWYTKTHPSDLLTYVWEHAGGINGALSLVHDIEVFSKGTKHGQVNGEYHYVCQRHQDLENMYEKEFQSILRWCEEKFGTEKWEDATGEYVEVA